MELNQIRYFLAVAQTLHFTKAAENCNVSQPALTRAIQKLEEEFGGPLFHRERAYTQLTDLGQQVLPSLERALAATQQARSIADAFRRRETSPLRIGLEISVPAAVLTPVMVTLRGRNTDIELTLRTGSQTDLCDAILASDIDLALLIDAPELPERLHRWRLFAERYVVLCQTDHRFRDHVAISPADLADECVLLSAETSCPIRKYVESVCEEAGVRPRRQHYGSSIEQVLEMIQASLGVAVTGERQPAGPPLLRRPFAATPGERTIVLTAAAGRQLGPTPALFMKLMRARAWTRNDDAVHEAA